MGVSGVTKLGMGQSVCWSVIRVRTSSERAERVVACHTGESGAMNR